MSFTSEQVVPNPDGAAHAFRVDIEEKERSAPKARYTLLRIPFGADGLIPLQFPLPAAKPSTNPCSPEADIEYAVRVRVYRPGYRTIEIRAGEETREWQWRPANFLEQEKAIDALLGVQSRLDVFGWWLRIAVAPVTELCGSPWPDGSQTIGDSGLLPGSVSASHREVLLFAAGEYQRLADVCSASSPTMGKMRERLSAKSAQMIRYADELTVEEFYRNQSKLASRVRVFSVADESRRQETR